MSGLKLLTLLLLPVGTALCAGLLAALLWRRCRRCALGVAGAGLAWLWLWATPLAADAVTVLLEAQYPMQAAGTLPTADAVLLLGGDPRGWQPVCIVDAQHCSRTAFAATIYALGRAPLVLASGALVLEHGKTEAARMREQLLGMGVPDAAILVEATARNSRENISAAAPMLRARKVRRVLLATSATHMPRAMANAAALNMEVIAAPSDFDPAVGRIRGLRALLPQQLALWRSERALKEFLGLAHQAVFGDARLAGAP